ncbi:tetratricopeptide repeat protein [Streptomyces sp. NPDC087658]|uniref:tetratricopeptide repeat protein n=1 Tax=Streptomyces sp. NPDC087658 TaxID=3365800 RepID=UPI003804C62B
MSQPASHPSPRPRHLPPHARPDGRGRRRLRGGVVALALGATFFAVGAVGLAGRDAAPAGGEAAAGVRPGSPEAMRERLRRLPEDAPGWASLGMAYVQQARTTADPATYDKAESALRTSLKVQPRDNYAAQTGMGALAAARHDFAAALDWGRRAVATNPAGSGAYGVLADAHTQLGQYEASYQDVQRMIDLRPDTASLARASYTWELRGDIARARALMERALNDAPTPGDQAFTHAHLATLAVESGDARTGLREAEYGLRANPRDPQLLEARARAHSALGDSRRAVADYTAAVAITPLPQYVLGLGELQQSLGHTAAAQEQYALLRAQERLRVAAKTPADVDAILFEADHGDARRAVGMGRTAVENRPFIAVQDAYAWALHRAGQDTRALPYANRALALGTRSALSHYHRAMIEQSLGDLTAARRDLETALAMDPHFHPLHAPAARTALRALQRIDSAS